ncbi:LlaJI family restriction endonuclease [Bifidobacterium callimiconis]|uniref:LlaJI family restriction endonuclease n=1 Tax=Bifidobacterium callimiconis TaxID=2306973 RepID=A0A430FGN3_9BIFI|nr:LlaJI family restriction endonuclease [Bifidobacterium callimiconis]RSX52033.1 LlaJI family restriction endonuclease [Bifidobacterium callimiconis]
MMGRFFIEGLPYSKSDLAEACIDGSAWGHGASENEALEQEADAGKDPDISKVMNCLQSMRLGRKRLLSSTHAGLTFNYVGVVALYRHVFVVLPKYYDPHGRQIAEMPWLTSTLNSVLAAIRRYHELRAAAKQQDKISFDPSALHISVEQNRMDLYAFLLQDYAEQGPYREARRIRELDGDGLIDWSRTINQINPLVTGGRPAYMEFVTTRRRRDEANFIARVQEAVISEICAFMDSSGLGDLLHLQSFPLNVETLDNLGGADYLASRLERELVVRFDTRSKRLLGALIDYLRGRARAVNDVMIAEGTSSFNLVWESICQSLFHDSSRDIPMQKPHWKYRLNEDMLWNMDESDGDDRKAVEAEQGDDEAEADDRDGYGNADPHTLIPDVINKDDPNGWYILDAKYYVPKYTAKSITGMPGIGDVIKQYFYMMAISERGSGIRVLGNAFLIPGRIPSGEGASSAQLDNRCLLLQRGKVSLGFVGAFLGNEEDLQAGDVKMFEMDPEQAIDMYTDPSGDDGTRSGRYLNAMFDSARIDEDGFKHGIPA